MSRRMEDARAALVGTLADAHIGALPFIIHEQAEHIEELSRRLVSVASFVHQLHEGLLEAAEESRANVETAEEASAEVAVLIEAQRTQLGGAGYSVWELEMLDAQEQASTSMRHGQDRVRALARDLENPIGFARSLPRSRVRLASKQLDAPTIAPILRYSRTCSARRLTAR